MLCISSKVSNIFKITQGKGIEMLEKLYAYYNVVTFPRVF